MSKSLRGIPLLRNVLRDFHTEYTGTNTAKLFDLPNTWGIVGLDFMVHNRDAANSLTVKIDSGEAITVLPKEVLAFSDTLFDTVSITNAGAAAFDFILAGISLQTATLIASGRLG